MKSIIEQIHHEFETAHMTHLLPCVQPSTEELYNLGFRMAKNTEDYEYGHESLREYAQVYLTRYPNNRFISEKQVEKICKKYGLLCAPVDNFIGEIPPTKVAAIISFTVAKGDIETRMIEGSADYQYVSRRELLDSNNRPQATWPRSENKPEPQDPTERMPLHNAWICATEKEIDTTNLVKVGHNIGTLQVNDPIVLQPVKGGFLIVAAWGDEASDPDVVNHTMN